MKGIATFFHLCSGASLTILKRYPTERAKYAGIGATVFFTGLLAAGAAAYAFYTVFDDWLVSTSLGFVWGLMIFNLDRFIVSSMRKTGQRKKDWYLALPRLLLAVLIAIVISRPLELKIFEKEINNELVLMEQELRIQQDSVISARFNTQSIALQEEKEALATTIQSAQKNWLFLENEAIAEADGTGGTKQRNAGPIYKMKKQRADLAGKYLDSLRSSSAERLNKINASLDSLQILIAEEKLSTNEMQYDGLAARLEGSFRITQKSRIMAVASWFIVLLFIAVECSPIFVKLMSSKGPYDDRLFLHEEKVHLSITEQVGKERTAVRRNTQNLEEPDKKWVEIAIEK